MKGTGCIKISKKSGFLEGMSLRDTEGKFMVREGKKRLSVNRLGKVEGRGLEERVKEVVVREDVSGTRRAEEE